MEIEAVQKVCMSGLEFKDGKLLLNPQDFPANREKGVINQIHTEQSHSESEAEHHLNNVSSINESLSLNESPKKILNKSGSVELDEYGKALVTEMMENSESVSLWLVAQIELYSNLCKGRNFKWTQNVSQIFSREFLLTAIWDQNYYQLKSPLYNLLTSMYIDQEPLNLTSYP